MKVTLHLEGTKMELIEQLMEFANTLAPVVGSGPAPTAKAAKPAKAAKKAPEPEAEAEEETPADEEEEFGDLDGEESEEAEEEAEEGISDKDLLAAFQAFAKGEDKKKKGNRDAAKAILKKLKVKSVKDIPQDKRAEVMKQVK